MKIKKFEDLEVWQSARKVVANIYKLSEKGKFSSDFGLKNQIQRSAVSVMSNIAEGFERGTTNGLIQFLYISKGSCGELRSQLYIALDLNYISASEFKEHYLTVEKISRSISGFIKYLKSSKS